MRTSSKKPRKQRLYEYKISKHEAHKLMNVQLSKKIRQDKGIRNIPVRQGDSVMVVRGEYKGKTGKVNRTDPSLARVYIDGIVKKKTDASEISVPIHPSNLVITKYSTKDRERLILINRRIESEDQKLDIESVLAEAEAEEEDLIEFDEEELDEEDDLLLDEDIEDEFEMVDEDLDEESDEDLDEDLDDEEKEDEA